MDNVIPLFNNPPPAAEDSKWVEKFTEETLCHSLYLMQCVAEAESEVEFRKAAKRLMEDVAAWQV